MAILTALVIATIILTAVFVGYQAWQDSLHEEPEKHSQNIEIKSIHPDFKQSSFNGNFDLSFTIR